MKKIVYALLLINLIGYSQSEKSVENFNKVTSFDQIDVVLIQANENKVVFTGEGSKDVELVNKNGELKIRMPFSKMLSGDNISATVYFKNIDAVEANEGSRIACESVLKSTDFNVIAKEGSEIKIKLDVDKLTIKTENGSTISVEGKATNQDALVNSGGIYNADNLVTNQTVITVNAGGEADIYATDLVEAKVRAGGEIMIYGKPKQINQKVIAGGTIKEVK